MSDEGSSPYNLQKPPIGNQLRDHTVPQNFLLIIFGGKPNPNSSTRTPVILAAKKCPNSWTKTKIDKAMIKIKISIKYDN